MKKFLILLFILLAACNSDSEQETAGQNEAGQEQDRQFQQEAETILTELEIPWDLEMVEDIVLISERPGSIVKMENEEMTRKPVQLENPLADRPEAGLLGIAVPDSYLENQQVAAYYSYTSDQGVFQRIAILEEQEEEWLEIKTILDRIPGGMYHQGGRIEIGPDEKLYATTGDATEPGLAQEQDGLAGKILRMNLDGSVPEDNPFDNSLVYSYGHRNPQGLAWNEAGELYATEHGNQAHDEINRIQAGYNYGWPEIEGSVEAEGMETPLVHSGSGETWAPSGMAYLDDNFYFGSLRGEAVRQFNPEDHSVAVIAEGYGRIRDVMAVEEGMYFITNNTDGRGNPGDKDDRLMLLRQTGSD